MADKETPTPSSNVHKGERWTSDPDTVEVADRYAERVGEQDTGTGGISNRPLSEEIGRQESLPDRGTSKREETGEGDVEQ